MKHALLILLCVTSALLPVQAAEPSATKLPAAGKWSATASAKVVAYRFKLPHELANDQPGRTVQSGFSLINNAGVNVTLLDKLAVKSVELTQAQTQELLAGVFSSRKKMEPAACYDPHHIVLFYDAAGVLTHAIEICFGCTGISTAPGLTKAQWYKHDFGALAALFGTLGLWDQSRTPQEYSRLLQE